MTPLSPETILVLVRAFSFWCVFDSPAFSGESGQPEPDTRPTLPLRGVVILRSSESPKSPNRDATSTQHVE